MPLMTCVSIIWVPHQFFKKTESRLSNQIFPPWLIVGVETRRFEGRTPSRRGRHGQQAGFHRHRVAREQGTLYARDYNGTGPAFVLMHGFPDNLRIYDDLIPYLTAAGRRVVAFDFLGFGASDKPAAASYSFAQQLGDLSAVIQALGLGKVVLVPHDSSGIAAVNFAVGHPYNVDSLCILNSAYDNSPLNEGPRHGRRLRPRCSRHAHIRHHRLWSRGSRRDDAGTPRTRTRGDSPSPGSHLAMRSDLSPQAGRGDLNRIKPARRRYKGCRRR
jgi:pimeloyl-ACP methyl ester carboxylesterase